jgi:hypothetical protein
MSIDCSGQQPTRTAGFAEPAGGDQRRDQGGVGALAVGEAHLTAQESCEVGEAQEGDGLAGPGGGADHGHGLAPQLGRWDDMAALAPTAQVAIQGVTCGFWWGWQASNLRPSDYESLPCRPPDTT